MVDRPEAAHQVAVDYPVAGCQAAACRMAGRAAGQAATLAAAPVVALFPAAAGQAVAAAG